MRVLGSDGLKGAADARRSFVVYAEPGTTLADIKDRKYWGLVAPQLTVGDRIEVQGEGGTFFADLFVRDVGKTWAKMAVHSKSEHPRLNDIGESEWDAWKELYEITLNFPQGHVVQRKRDKAIMFSSARRDEAEAWARTDARK